MANIELLVVPEPQFPNFLQRTANAVTGPTGSGMTGPTGAIQTGPTGAIQTGPTGAIQTGPTGAASTQTGPTGAIQTGPTGAVISGPTGADSTQTGPTGAIQTGPTGAVISGPTGANSLTTGPTGVESFAAVGQVIEDVNAMGNCTGNKTVDLSLGNVVTATLTGAGIWDFSNVAAAGKSSTVMFKLTNAGTNITWNPVPKWQGGTPPTMTAAGVDILIFNTVDGGTTWDGIASSLDSK